ncbi:MAG: prepilin-type N-terminal cleavage/methylation domain-containing protein [Armatimonadota bacterium]
MRKYRAAGFTLVEVIVVLAIVAVLAAIIVPVFSTSGKRVHQQTCINNLHTLGVNLTQYWQDYGEYPAAPSPAYLRTTDPQFVPFGYLPTEAVVAPKPLPTDPPPLPDYPQPIGIYTGNEPSKYDVQIKITYADTVSPSIDDPDQFIWTEDPARKSWYGPFPIPVNPDTGKPDAFALHQGISIRFGEALGHSTADAWSIALDTRLPADWKQWMPAREAGVYAEIVGNQLAGTTTFPVKTLAQAENLETYRQAENGRAYVEIVNTNGNWQAAVLKSVDVPGQTVTLYDDYALEDSFLDGSRIYPGYIEFPPDEENFITGNFGLARLLGIYGMSKKLFHCPQIETTRDVQTDANLRAATEGSGYARNIRFDTLLSGFNTYDVTYNYDQYHNAIRYFDARLGFGSMNASRQLKEKYPPADTVVCWCYGHRRDQTPAYEPGDPEGPDVQGDGALVKAQQSRRGDKVLVLWVDGSVAAVSPYTIRGADNMHYWVPPFLYAQGEWQK